MPGSSPTIDLRDPVKRLKSVDFPTFGRPIIATKGIGITFDNSKTSTGAQASRLLLVRSGRLSALRASFRAWFASPKIIKPASAGWNFEL